MRVAVRGLTSGRPSPRARPILHTREASREACCPPASRPGRLWMLTAEAEDPDRRKVFRPTPVRLRRWRPIATRPAATRITDAWNPSFSASGNGGNPLRRRHGRPSRTYWATMTTSMGRRTNRQRRHGRTRVSRPNQGERDQPEPDREEREEREGADDGEDWLRPTATGCGVADRRRSRARRPRPIASATIEVACTANEGSQGTGSRDVGARRPEEAEARRADDERPAPDRARRPGLDERGRPVHLAIVRARSSRREPATTTREGVVSLERFTGGAARTRRLASLGPVPDDVARCPPWRARRGTRAVVGTPRLLLLARVIFGLTILGIAAGSVVHDPRWAGRSRSATSSSSSASALPGHRIRPGDPPAGQRGQLAGARDRRNLRARRVLESYARYALHGGAGGRDLGASCVAIDIQLGADSGSPRPSSSCSSPTGICRLPGGAGSRGSSAPAS